MVRITPGRLLFSGLALLAAVAAALWLLPSDDYIFLPDEAKAVEPLVHVQGEKRADGPGGIYLVDVLVRRANLLERLFPSIHGGSTLVPESAFKTPGVSNKQRQQADLQEMERSQEIGAAVALRSLGYRVRATATGVLVESVVTGTPSVGKLAPGDVITTVNGRRVRSIHELRAALRPVRPGTDVTLVVRNEKKLRQVTVGTVPDPNRPGRAFMGILVAQAASIRLPLRVQVNTGDIGGPSAGLAFALDVVEELGRNVDGGRKVAATGQLELDGAVVPVGGVKQKTIGARQSGVDVLVVPAENAPTARRYAGDVRVLSVRSFAQALRRLRALPRR
jgi:PDZ domain-containing protein